ncbi:hypothetical protein PG994_002624 [Apiospora phragmitis]|uniref:Ecp2 effector protein-like domain-containing protein n=1 Tax=Apiospora phragmitis TaxID=2905665 RepID=A0ABR1W6X8_9PEZI
MYIFALLVTLLFAALHAHGVAIPAKALRDSDDMPVNPKVTVTFITANGTRINGTPVAKVGTRLDGTPAAKVPQVNFVHTATTQSLCQRSEYKPKDLSTIFPPLTGNRADICRQLADFVTNSYFGYWDTWDYDNVSVILYSVGDCAFYVSGVSIRGSDGHVWIDNQDVGDAATVAINAFGHDGVVAAAGLFECDQPSGPNQIAWFLEKNFGYTQMPR